ncbi:MAG: hypothetical protein R3C14_34900 [Caldilineaceae bacterium]
MKRTLFSPPLVARPWRSHGQLLLMIALALLFTASFGTLLRAQSSNCGNLIANSGFETSSGWETQSNGAYALISPYLTRSGAQAAHLGGVNNAKDSLSTTLTLPTDSQSLTLSFWWLIDSQEAGSADDGLTLVVADSAGNPLKSLLTLSSADAAQRWQESQLDLRAYAGQTVQLQWLAQTDETLVTDFFIDDVAVTACAAGSQDFRLFLPITNR